ncbi:hypothetical protein RV10_GL003332 [Enterococcus pallens]|nr:hypothetical protein RV10_GL003332 [Enterococcus pallens]
MPLFRIYFGNGQNRQKKFILGMKILCLEIFATRENKDIIKMDHLMLEFT